MALIRFKQSYIDQANAEKAHKLLQMFWIENKPNTELVGGSAPAPISNDPKLSAANELLR